MRCADGRNHQLVIVSLICEEAKQQHKQYTKRMLPWFVIPECNIRLDLVLNLLKLEERHPGSGSALAYEQADAVIGSACEHTIARHLKWARRLVADSTLEASELMAELVAFATLPEVRAGGRGVAELQRYLTALTVARRRAYGRVGGGAAPRHHPLPASALRGGARPQPGGTTIESSITARRLVRYQLSIPPMEASTWMYYWGPPTIWPNWKSTCC